jgi:RimJ/RimL family protein N-acetyltransferase
MRTLTTPRLNVRPLEARDLEAFYAITGDAEAMRLMGDGQPLTLEQTREWIAVSQRNYALHARGCMAVLERETGAFVGFCGLVASDDRRRIELIYALSPAVWGRGYATEAARAMLEYGATILDTVYASVYPQNAASLRVLEKLGFKQTHVADDGVVHLEFANGGHA